MDGHVVTIRSQLGHVIRLMIRNGQAVLSIGEPVSEQNPSGGSGQGPKEAESSPLEEGVFVLLVSTEGRVMSLGYSKCIICMQEISCAIESDREMMVCSLSSNGMSSGQLEVSYAEPTFFPRVPISFGMIGSEESEMMSFIGCISDLAINGDSSGFR